MTEKPPTSKGASYGKALFGWIWDGNQVMKNVGTYSVKDNVCYHCPGVGCSWFSIVRFEVVPDEKKHGGLELTYSVDGPALFDAFKGIKKYVSDVRVFPGTMVHVLSDEVPEDELTKRGLTRVDAEASRKVVLVGDGPLHDRHRRTYERYVGSRAARALAVPDEVAEALSSGDFPVVRVEQGKKVDVARKLECRKEGLVQARLDRKFLLPFSKKAELEIHVIDLLDGRVLVGLICEEKRYRWNQYFLTVQM